VQNIDIACLHSRIMSHGRIGQIRGRSIIACNYRIILI